jgi:hypothetical protein
MGLLDCISMPFAFWIQTPEFSLLIIPSMLHSFCFRFHPRVWYYLLQEVATFIPDSGDLMRYSLGQG